MSHPFFKDLDLKGILNKEVVPSFIPKVPDMAQLRANANVVSFKDLQETAIPNPKKELVNQKMNDFEIFGDFN